MNKPVFSIRKNASGEFYFTFDDKNGESIAISDEYKTKQNCQIGIQSSKDNCSQEKFKVDNSKYHFTQFSKNGRAILISVGYDVMSGAVDEIIHFIENAPQAEIIDITKRKRK